MNLLDHLLDHHPTEFVVYMASFALIQVAAIYIVSRLILGGVRRIGKDIITANIEYPERPLTISFSPDYPGLRAAYRTDYWVRTAPGQTEVLFFHPEHRRWQDAAISYGVGTAFVDSKLVAFRAVPTDMDECMIRELQRVAETRVIPPTLLERLACFDPNEVFSVVEACGMVRPFSAALDAILAQVPEGVDLAAMARAFAGPNRAIDLG